VTRFGSEAGLPVPGELRTAWRISTLLLIIDKCRGRKASWPQMHVLSWALLSRMTVDELRGLLSAENTVDRPLVAIDPAVNATVDLAFGFDLIDRSGDTVALTEAGERALQSVRASESFVAERQLLDSVHGRITQTQARAAITAAGLL
jgi:hypothetical protein